MPASETNVWGMRPAFKRGESPGWPFWLLLAAWFCANSPQALTYHLIVWAKGGSHFSHQERLKADVAFLLSGRKAAGLQKAIAAVPARPVAPPVPAEAVLKKLDLSTPVFTASDVPLPGALGYPEPAFRVPAGSRLEPLLTPPRSPQAA